MKFIRFCIGGILFIILIWLLIFTDHLLGYVFA
jgi:hypothetical protein